MGTLIDASVLIAAERGRLDVETIFAAPDRRDEPVAIAAITASELLHGVQRLAGVRRVRAQGWVDRWLDALPVISFDSTMLLRGLPLCAIGMAAACAGETGRETEPQVSVELQTAETPLYHSASSSDPRVATIGALSGAMFLEPDRFVFVDALSRQLVFIDAVSGEVLVVGGQGDGPGEYAFPRLLSPLDNGGVAVWDRLKMRLTLVNPDGTVAQTANYTSMATSSPDFLVGNVSVVARFADGTLAFREPLRIPRNGQRQLVGEYRDTLQYLIQSPTQPPRPVARLLDAEMNRSVRGSNRSESTVIFGHLSLSTQAGQHLALTQTDMGVVQILDRSGAHVGTVPLPSGTAVTEDDVAAERARRKASAEATARRFAELSGDPVSSVDLDERIASIPVRRLARPIDRLAGDLNGRLWLRLFRPGAEWEEWQVWDIAGEVPALQFVLTLPMGEEFLDAAGNRVLLRQRDEMDVSSLVVRQIDAIRLVASEGANGAD